MNIGGIFPRHKEFTESSNTLLLANARCAFRILEDKFKPNTVWMPDYYCPSMLDAFKSKVKYYKVNNNLLLVPPPAERGDLVIAIDYFGFPHDETIHVVKRNAFLAVDMSHAFFNKPNPNADFLIYSPRKSFPLPDGGILISKQPIKCSLEDQTWFCKSLLAMDYRLNNEQDNETWYKLSRETKCAPIGYYAMSHYSKHMLSIFDSQIATKSKENFKILLEQLKHCSLFKHLPDIVPYGFPILLENRDYVQKALFKYKIFLPIHWEINHPLAKQILTIPCDYRYDAKDMTYIIEKLLKHM